LAKRKTTQALESASAAQSDFSPKKRDRENIFAVGKVLTDTYEIRGILGQGGMGQVYEAYDRRLHRHVAVKVAWPKVGASAVRKEAQALAAIRHPCVAVVYACGTHAGIEYVVMERVSGETLEAHLGRRAQTRKPFSIAEVLEILAPLSDGLSAVHRAGIAHRDVKPDNVMLAPGGRVVLMDFGVFLPEFAVGSDGMIMGSPPYMAPETLRGSVGSGGGFLVDVYSFGVVAFELLTHRLPFDGEDAHELYAAHKANEAPRLRTLRDDVPPALDTLVAGLLQIDPDDRPQSMQEVGWQLRALASKTAPAPARGRT